MTGSVLQEYIGMYGIRGGLGVRVYGREGWRAWDIELGPRRVWGLGV